MGVLGIIISLALLMYLAYRGFSVIILAPILALFAAFLGGGAPLLATYTEVFMVNLANYAKTYFPLFLLGAVFGKVLDDSGAAKSIAHFIANKLGKDKAILAIVLSCAVLTYGGVSLFVVAFAVYPIAAALFKEAGIPKRLIPASIALGSFTFTMTALPGTPQIQNAIPMPFFGTDAYAAPVLGIVGALIMAVGGVTWISYRAKVAMAKGEGYGNHKEEVLEEDNRNLPNIFMAIIPIITVLVLNFVLSKSVFPNLDTAYLETFGTSIQKVVGIWSLIVSLVVSILLTIALNFKNFKSVKNSVNQGAIGSLLAILNTASEVGYGNVIASLAAFAVVKGALLGISSNPLIAEAISVSALAGITGSASGGLSIALGALGETYLQNAQAMGIDPQVLHRIATMACGGLDSLPHNGAVITLLTITGLTHRESYADIGMCTVVIPIVAVAAAIVLASFGIV
jgi:H+/gluconate symporter-like permease